MTMNFRTLPLKDCPVLISQMAGLQDYRPQKSYAQSIKKLGEKDSLVSLAMHRHRVVGCITATPAIAFPFLQEKQAFIESVVGDSLERYVVRSTFHVHRDWVGQRIGTQLDQLVRSEAKSSGFLWCVEFGYETRQVLSWFRSRPGATSIGLEDVAGDPVYVSPVV